ncbi:MAG: glycosyltransferase [Lachnospiraceae bacterium]|nr:glycosyltransferase [Lachnospiraceae bacterium]
MIRLLKEKLADSVRADYEKRKHRAEADSDFRAYTEEETEQWERRLPDKGCIPREEADRIRAARTREVSVSVIIPTKDHPELLGRCVDALVRTIDPEKERVRYEIIVTDNGSSTENRKIINEILDTAKGSSGPYDCRYLVQTEEFHFSRMCNRGAAASGNELLLFLNDDTEADGAGWLSELCAFALSEKAGAVGMKLCYPHKEGEVPRIQHCGVVNEFYGPVHVLSESPDDVRYFWDYTRTVRACVAVTGACLMIRRELFLEQGGFCEELPVAFNDVDLCYTLYERGLRNLCCNTVHMLHHESMSRGDDRKDDEKLLRLSRDLAILKKRHPRTFGRDPYFDARLSTGPSIVPFTGGSDRLTGELARQRGRVFSPEASAYRHDACVHVNVEYAGRLRDGTDVRGTGQDEGAKDWLIRGFSFVAGADNALYTRRLLLQRLREEEDGSTSGEGKILSFALTEEYRPDKALRFSDQCNCALGGFQTRIGEEALAPGTYRIGIAAHKRYSRQKLYHWGVILLHAE